VEGQADNRYIKYQAIDKDGICKVGEEMRPGYVMCNKESPLDTTSNIAGTEFGFSSGIASQVSYKPSNLTYRGAAPSYVDKVLITSNESEQFLIKVMLRQVRRPEIGDKFASRHGQ
jgi:DNA-directed RNA polymerase III subunit RPC2